MKKTLIITWVVFLLALVGVVLWSRHYARCEAAHAVAEQEQKEFAFWKAKLLPAYEAIEMKHVADPSTREELFGPLLDVVRGLP